VAISKGYLVDPIIYAYTKQQAIADGVYIDVTDAAKSSGFCVPVFITCGVRDACIQGPGVGDDQVPERLWLFLLRLSFVIERAKLADTRVSFRFLSTGADGPPRTVDLIAAIEPDPQTLEPFLVVFLPEED
jgi:hypothetical protein